MLREYVSMHFSGAPVVPDLLTDESYLQPYDGSGSGSGSSKVNRFFSVPRGDPSRLYVEREDPNLTYLMTHPQFGATRAIAGTYTCLAVGENSNTSQDITLQLSGNSVLQHSIVRYLYTSISFYSTQSQKCNQSENFSGRRFGCDQVKCTRVILYIPRNTGMMRFFMYNLSTCPCCACTFYYTVVGRHHLK